MTTWLVTRHPGALEWLTSRGFGDAHHVLHLELSRVAPGDRVVGTLPVNLVAEVCARGARYLNLSLELRPASRGRELSAAELESHGARLEAFVVTRLDDLTSEG